MTKIIVVSRDREENFEEDIEKMQKEGYDPIYETFRVNDYRGAIGHDRTHYILMRKMKGSKGKILDIEG